MTDSSYFSITNHIDYQKHMKNFVPKEKCLKILDEESKRGGLCQPIDSANKEQLKQAIMEAPIHEHPQYRELMQKFEESQKRSLMGQGGGSKGFPFFPKTSVKNAEEYKKMQTKVKELTKKVKNVCSLSKSGPSGIAPITAHPDYNQDVR